MPIEKELKDLLNDTPIKKWKWIIVKNDVYENFLNELYPNVTIANQCIAFMRDKSPYCIICNSVLKDIRKDTCSHECKTIHSKNTGKDKVRIEKQRNTLMNKYGTTNIQSIEGIQEKRLNTMIELYGDKISPKSKDMIKSRVNNLNIKGKQTLKNKYGIDNPSKLEDHKDKIHKAIITKYGRLDYNNSEIYKNEIVDKHKKLNDKIFSESNISVISSTVGKYHNERLISFKCNKCGTEEYDVQRATILVRMTKSTTPCCKCSGISEGSVAQKEIYNLIESFGLDDLKLNANIGNTKLEMDIYCPSKNIAIEFDGLYWHSEDKKDKNYHLHKTEVAKDNGITLYHIFEDEWKYNKDIVISRLKNIFGVIDNKIFARKCELRIPNNDEEKQFLIRNHIQGYARSSISLGLYYDNELVSLMTFSKPSKAKGQKMEDGVYELLRFCNKLNTTVVGGASKLLNYFENNYEYNRIMSFADRRWSNGNLYYKLGFTFLGNTRINYWYFKTNDIIRIYRYKLRKNREDDQNKTEYENRKLQGYLRIWDCGSMKFEKKKEA